MIVSVYVYLVKFFGDLFERVYVFRVGKRSYFVFWNKKRGKEEVISDFNFLLYVVGLLGVY